MSSSERVFDSWQVTVQTERKRVWLQAHSDSVVNWKPKSCTVQLEGREDTENQSVKWKLKILIRKGKREQGKDLCWTGLRMTGETCRRWRRKDVTALIRSPSNTLEMIKLTVTCKSCAQ